MSGTVENARSPWFWLDEIVQGSEMGSTEHGRGKERCPAHGSSVKAEPCGAERGDCGHLYQVQHMVWDL